MTTDDLVYVSGLSRSTVLRVGQRRSWRGLPVDVIQKFSLACGVNLLACNKDHLRFVRHYLKAARLNGGPSQRGMIDRIVARLGGDGK